MEPNSTPPYASIACTCVHHHCTQVDPRTRQQLRTIRQVSCDVTPMSLGWRSSKGNLIEAAASHRRAPAATTERLHKPQIPQNQWKIWEKAKVLLWISLRLIETVGCSFAAETGDETVAAQDNCQPNKIPAPLLHSFTSPSLSHFLLVCCCCCCCCLAPFVSNFPQCHSSDTQTCTHC